MKPTDLTRKTLLAIFDRLLQYFGPRYWWPAETPFEVIVGAILTQQVAWRNTATAIAHLKREGRLSPQGILALPDPALWELIRPTRFYRQKADRLRAFCRVLQEDFGGELDRLFALDIKTLRRLLLALPGIGEETADSIILYAAGMPIFVIDAYTQRVFTRLGLIDRPMSYGSLQSRLMARLPRDTALYNEYHALLDGLGHHLCLRQSPRCQACPLDDLCGHHTEKAPS
ncbi:MAG: endonuclease III domain-containing protein [Thermoanaerobacterales bacterium]|nr:endonuclease III domain-containing protein [Thermoanaerobacterales bacterium]